MSHKTRFYLKRELGYEYHKLRCQTCGRKILVEIGLFGVSHNASVSATCGDCLKVSGSFRKKHPEEAKDIEKWLSE